MTRHHCTNGRSLPVIIVLVVQMAAMLPAAYAGVIIDRSKSNAAAAAVTAASSTLSCSQQEERAEGDCAVDDGSSNVIAGNNETSTCRSGRALEEDDQNDETQQGIVESSPDIVTSPASTSGLGSDLGEIQVLDDSRSQQVLDLIASARSYMQDVVHKEAKYEPVKDMCRNQHAQCAFWAALGECDKNPGYMKVNCAPVCRSCEQLHVETRCPLDPDAVDALYPGDLDRMFTRITTDPEYARYEPTVLSRPDYAPEDSILGPVENNNVTYKVGGPWLVTFENVLSDEEAERLIELGAEEGYKRSADVGERKADGTYTAQTNNGRTSTNAWCNSACYEDPIAKRVMERIANITGIAEGNSEYLQLLRYERTQFYQTHNDYIPYQRERPTGVRILTFYMYLDEVEEGGGTNFPRLGLTVTPKKGRAVLWPSVLNSHPNMKDSRTDHQALPVVRGTKYGANAWIHQRDFKTPNAIGCQ